MKVLIKKINPTLIASDLDQKLRLDGQKSNMILKSVLIKNLHKSPIFTHITPLIYAQDQRFLISTQITHTPSSQTPQNPNKHQNHTPSAYTLDFLRFRSPKSNPTFTHIPSQLLTCLFIQTLKKSLAPPTSLNYFSLFYSIK